MALLEQKFGIFAIINNKRKETISAKAWAMRLY
jgi:hypothetical protein